jgi:hypothetical protein
VRNNELEMGTMETFDFDISLVGTGRVFPEQIEKADWIGYHGTSSYYSPRIERDGFLREKPISIDDIDLVIDLSSKFGIDNESTRGFKTLQSLSFSPIAELALSYARPQSLGGQGVGYVRALAERVVAEYADELTDEERRRLGEIVALVDNVRAQDPVIYAVDLEGLSPMEYQTLTRAVHVFTAIPPERIRAKICVKGNVDYALIKVKNHRDFLQQVFWSSKPHYIKRIPK